MTWWQLAAGPPGVKPDQPDQATRLSEEERAHECELGFVSSCINAVRGVNDAQRRRSLFGRVGPVVERACEAADAMACADLAEIHAYGAARDPALARALREKSCALGYGHDCELLKFEAPGDHFRRTSRQSRPVRSYLIGEISSAPAGFSNLARKTCWPVTA